jgi:hypothetical protein
LRNFRSLKLVGSFHVSIYKNVVYECAPQVFERPDQRFHGRQKSAVMKRTCNRLVAAVFVWATFDSPAAQSIVWMTRTNSAN